MYVNRLIPSSRTIWISFETHRCLCAFLTMQRFTPEDFLICEERMLKTGNPFFNCLCYLSMFQNPDLTDFGAWVRNCKNAVSTIGKLCDRRFKPHEKDFYAMGLAVRTFPFDEKRSQFVVNEDDLYSFLKFPVDTEENIWAMYLIGTIAVDKMEFGPDGTRDVSLFIQLLKRNLDIKELYEQLKTIHFSEKKRSVVYEPQCDIQVDQ